MSNYTSLYKGKLTPSDMTNVVNFIWSEDVKSRLRKRLQNALRDAKEILSTTSPIDNTTEAQSRKGNGKFKYDKNGNKYALGRPWKMDDNVSAEHYHYKTTVLSRGKQEYGFSGKMFNTDSYVKALNEGGYNSLMPFHYERVERTSDGRFSEQSPEGNFIVEAIMKALKMNNLK